MKEIQPIQIWSPLGYKEIKYIDLTDFSGYKFDNGVGLVTYLLVGTDQSGYYENKIEIPANIVQQWGADDEIIFTYVASTLGLVII